MWDINTKTTGIIISVSVLMLMCIFHEAGHFLYAKHKQWNPTLGANRFGFYVRCDAVGTKKEYVKMSLSGILLGLPIVLFYDGATQPVLIIWYLVACIGDFIIIFKALVLEPKKEQKIGETVRAFFEGEQT